MKSTLFLMATMANLPFSLGQSSLASSSLSTIVTGSGSSTITSAPSGTTSSTTREPTTATVKVGVNHDFQPDSITAEPGDVIKFIFYPTNHSVVRAAYENPCIPYNYVVAGGDTFFSGPEISSSNDNHPEWYLTVNDTEPYFFYCSAPGSCIGSHMVGVINPNENYTLEAQKSALQDVKFQLSPGEPWPAEASSSSTPTSSATTTSTGSISTSSAPSNSSSGGGTSLSGGAIAGIAIGGAAVLIISVALIWFCGRKGGIEKGYRKSTIVNPPPPTMMEANYGNQPKSPPPPTYRDSPYGSQAEAFRSTSPAQWSQTGSPHNSYAGYPSPGLSSPWSGVQGQGEPPKAASPGPVEMMGDVHHPGSPPPGRHEFPG